MIDTMWALRALNIILSQINVKTSAQQSFSSKMGRIRTATSNILSNILSKSEKLFQNISYLWSLHLNHRDEIF